MPWRWCITKRCRWSTLSIPSAALIAAISPTLPVESMLERSCAPSRSTSLDRRRRRSSSRHRLTIVLFSHSSNLAASRSRGRWRQVATERLLHDVMGVSLIAEDGRRRSEHSLQPRRDERLECIGVAACRPSNEVLVADGHCPDALRHVHTIRTNGRWSAFDLTRTSRTSPRRGYYLSAAFRGVSGTGRCNSGIDPAPDAHLGSLGSPRGRSPASGGAYWAISGYAFRALWLRAFSGNRQLGPLGEHDTGEHPAGVAQLAERQPSKLNVAGSIPVSRSIQTDERPQRSPCCVRPRQRRVAMHRRRRLRPGGYHSPRDGHGWRIRAPGPARLPVERLVEASFAFLLEREPRESILGTFDLSAISRYFPEYEKRDPHELCLVGRPLERGPRPDRLPQAPQPRVPPRVSALLKPAAPRLSVPPPLVWWPPVAGHPERSGRPRWP